MTIMKKVKKLWEIARPSYSKEVRLSGFKKYIAGVKLIGDYEIIKSDVKTGNPSYFILRVDFRIKGIGPDDVYTYGEIIYSDGKVSAGFEMPYAVGDLYIWIEKGKFGLELFEYAIKEYSKASLVVKAPEIPKNSVVFGKQALLKDFAPRPKITEKIKLVGTKQLNLDEFGFKPALPKKKYKKTYPDYYDYTYGYDFNTQSYRSPKKKDKKKNGR